MQTQSMSRNVESEEPSPLRIEPRVDRTESPMTQELRRVNETLHKRVAELEAQLSNPQSLHGSRAHGQFPWLDIARRDVIQVPSLEMDF